MEERNLLSALSFDFGTATSPVAAGFTQVTPGTTYSSAQGYGWQSGTLLAVDRGIGTDLARDLNYTPAGTFAVDLPSGIYTVTLTVGDLGHLHDQMQLSLEGAVVNTLTTPAGEILTTGYTVAVSDGQLTLRLQDLGGQDPNVVLEGLEIAPAPAPGSVLVPRQFDFGTSTSPVAAGFTQVTSGTTYTTAQGYGWQSGTLLAVDRGTGTDLARDLNYTPAGTFAVDVPSGTYTVTLTVGDLGHNHDQMQYSLEGAVVDTLNTAPGEIVTKSYTVTVSDGQLNLRLQDQGGGDPNVVLGGLVIANAAAPAGTTAVTSDPAVDLQATDEDEVSAGQEQPLEALPPGTATTDTDSGTDTADPGSGAGSSMTGGDSGSGVSEGGSATEETPVGSVSETTGAGSSETPTGTEGSDSTLPQDSSTPTEEEVNVLTDDGSGSLPTQDHSESTPTEGDSTPTDDGGGNTPSVSDSEDPIPGDTGLSGGIDLGDGFFHNPDTDEWIIPDSTETGSGSSDDISGDPLPDDNGGLDDLGSSLVDLGDGIFFDSVTGQYLFPDTTDTGSGSSDATSGDSSATTRDDNGSSSGFSGNLIDYDNLIGLGGGLFQDPVTGEYLFVEPPETASGDPLSDDGSGDSSGNLIDVGAGWFYDPVTEEYVLLGS